MPPKFTHCDLNPCNILARKGKVVGLIDWEFSGWYPDYWEYTSAWFGSVIRTDWQGMIVKILDQPRPEVLMMEEIRNKWWGEQYPVERRIMRGHPKESSLRVVRSFN